jgi:putative transposase
MELDLLKKKLPASADARRAFIDPRHQALSIRRQCDLLDLSRSTFYYLPATESKENLRLMRLLDKQYLKTPFPPRESKKRVCAWMSLYS